MDTFRPPKSGDALLASCDIAIVGGGMVGMTLAAALATHTDLSIALLEAHAESNDFAADTYHHRVSAISLSSVNIFKSLNLFAKMVAKRVSPFQAIQIWDKADSLAFASHEIGEPLLGYIIENNVMQQVLREHLQTRPNVTLFAPVQITDVKDDGKGVTIRWQDGQPLQARLAVAADGANSWLRQQAGIQVTTEHYEQHGIVATVTTEASHEKVARQVFLPTGPLAFLPLQMENLSSIVWSVPKQEAERLLALSDAEFNKALAFQFGHRLGAITQLGKRFAFPLRKQQASHYVSGRVVLVGDAAHVIHPLAGQGVNLGLLDAACLAEVIGIAHNEQRDFASVATLRQYERWRRADNLPLLTGVDLIKQLFACDLPSVQTLRSIGLQLTGRMGVLKNIFTRYAVGQREGLPILARVNHL